MGIFRWLKNSSHLTKCFHKTILNRQSHSKVPPSPTWKIYDSKDLPEVADIKKEQIDQLERLGLVELNNEDGINRLTRAINSANGLYVVDTSNVKPLDTVLENVALYLREDKVTEGDCKKDVLMNAVKVEEDYFVAPPGNIALKSRDK